MSAQGGKNIYGPKLEHTQKVLKSKHIEFVQMYPILVYKQYYGFFLPVITNTVVRKNLESWNNAKLKQSS